jgi:2-dehydropantoate 2-reductase
MSLENPVIAVIGAGAVGGYYGARLIQSGLDVHLLNRSECAHIRQFGMEIHSRDGDFYLSPKQVNVYDNPAQMPKADLILVTLKTTANRMLGELITPVLKSDSIILTLQNGLGNEEALAELFGRERVLGGMAFVCINRGKPGQILHTDHGKIQLGEPWAGPSERARRISELFAKSRVPCEVIANLPAGRWEKLMWNIPFNGLGAAMDKTTDQLIGDEHGLWLVRQLMREVIDTCKPLGVELKLALIEEKIRYTLTMGAYKTSMQIDRQLGRPMEVEAIIGRPVRSAQEHSVSTPCMKMLYEILGVLDDCK